MDRRFRPEIRLRLTNKIETITNEFALFYYSRFIIFISVFSLLNYVISRKHLEIILFNPRGSKIVSAPLLLTVFQLVVSETHRRKLYIVSTVGKSKTNTCTCIFCWSSVGIRHYLFVPAG